MKDAYYFSHDANASGDPKIRAMISKWGYEGYGWYWRIIELLREQPEYKYPLNKYTYDTFAQMLLTNRERITEFLSDCAHEFSDSRKGLFTIDECYLYSESFLTRMKLIDEKRECAKQSINKRWKDERRKRRQGDGFKDDTSVIRTNNERTTDVIQGKESKGKESKEKKSNIDAIFSSFTSNPDLLSSLNSFAEMRKEIKKPLTERAASLLVKNINELSKSPAQQIAILEQSIMNSWQGVFALKPGQGPQEAQRSRYREVD